MLKSSFGKTAIATVLAAALAVPASAYFQRSPAYAAARAAGQVGEKPDGYLGVVGAQSGDIEALVADINIKRRANYTERAQAQNVTLQEYAFAQGCELIQRTVPGEKYQTPAGAWETRTSAAPTRDPRCP
ncbi:YdbL family protein [Parerythrobacter aestuarii]|uniref:YdbL family protein n=1 Tax=Parerythrobacter aestuarii TaxID=3020909 RepID=UPI0024DE098C|nr:YdbL family protein [Parerythrobacter aestuarii]